MYFPSIIASLTLFAFGAQTAASGIAHVITFDPQADTHHARPKSLSLSAARLVLAQRAGVEDYHTADGLSEEVMDAVNAFGSRTRLVDQQSQNQRAFLLVEAGKVPSSLQSDTQFAVENAPSFSASEDLFYDLFRQAHPSASESKRDLYKLPHLESPLFHIAENIETFALRFNAFAGKGIPVTALIIPPGERSSHWGTYGMPNTQSPLKKRQTNHRIEVEEPMSASFPASSPAVAPLASNSSSAPLRGILPACYATRHACEETTRNCTGHGGCMLKSKNPTPPDSKQKSECWSCACKATKNDGKTTKWGGPACQKKDISAEFWLISLFTIGLVSLVTFAVGNLVSMGSEELPSVIGAGVSGPPRK